MAHTFQEYQNLLREKDDLIDRQRSILRTKEDLTGLLDDELNPGGENAASFLQKAIVRIGSGEAWTGPAASSMQITLSTMRTELLELAAYTRATLDGFYDTMQSRVEDLQKQISVTLSDLDAAGTAELYLRYLSGRDFKE